MKLGPVTKLVKENTAMSKNFDDDVLLLICDAIIIFRIYDQFEAIRKPNSRRMVCKTCIFIISNLIS